MTLTISKQKNKELLFDINSLKWEDLINFELDKLGIKNKIASEEIFYQIKNTLSNFVLKLKKRLKIKILYCKESYIKECDFTFDHNFNYNIVYLEGYWQSERYFETIKAFFLKKINFDSISSESIRVSNEN